MANYATLKAAIQQVIKTNGNEEITGALLQQSLLAMINSLGGYYQFAGIATPSTNPGTPDQNVFYLASTAGTYVNFGGLVLADGEIAILKYNGAWSKDSTGAASLENVNRLGTKLIKLTGFGNIGVYGGIQQIGDIYYNTNTKLLRKLVSGNASSGVYDTEPYQDGAIYTCNGALYVWDGSGLVNCQDSATQTYRLITARGAVMPSGWDFTTDYCHYVIPVNGGEKIVFANRANLMYFAVLKTYTPPTISTTLDYCTGFSGRQSVNVGSLPYTLPSDCRFLVINNPTGNYAFSKLEIDGISPLTGIYGAIFQLAGKIPDPYTAGEGITIDNNEISVDSETLPVPDVVTDGEKTQYEVKTSDFSESGFINKASGLLTSHTSYKATKSIPVKPGQIYKTNAVFFNSAVTAFYDADKVYHSQYVENFDTGIKSFTVPSGCYFMRMSCSTSVATPYAELTNPEFYGLIDLTDKVNAQAGYGKPHYSPFILFPQTKLPCVSFQFDDNTTKDSQLVDLFKSKGLVCAFAFIGSQSNINTYGEKYLGWAKDGFQIMNHSWNGTVFNTNNYTYETAMAAIMGAKNNIQKAGMQCNGFVSPSSEMANDFLPILKVAHAYAFTSATSSATANGRSQDTCQLHRYSLQSHTLAEIEQYIDDCITNDQIMTFYGHAADLVDDGDTTVFSLAKIGAILDYCIAKRDSGLLYVGGTDDCVKYFFDL